MVGNTESRYLSGFEPVDQEGINKLCIVNDSNRQQGLQTIEPMSIGETLCQRQCNR